MIEEETNSTKQYAELGFKNAKIFLLNDLEGDNLESDYQEFSWSDGDIFGCGLVFPPKKKSEELPYIFFTKNGSRIGYDIASEEEENLCPVVSLLACSVKINFGNDLVTDPFCYNFSEYKCIILEF
uniref:SPRY domain-containing protein n=1 Tax=Meloidogyne hapla TaxID=6305 RepID=A0A1I8BQM4_MELHA